MHRGLSIILLLYEKFITYLIVYSKVFYKVKVDEHSNGGLESAVVVQSEVTEVIVQQVEVGCWWNGEFLGKNNRTN